MSKKDSTTTQQVQIPQDVLARYNSVNSQAQTAAAKPFQAYSSNPNDFVAPLTAPQTAGISQSMAAANEAQPYFGAATGALQGAYASASPYFGAATGALAGGQGASQPYYDAATSSVLGGQAASQPYYGAAEGDITGAQSVGSGLAGASLQALQGANSNSNPLLKAAGKDYSSAYAGAQPYNLGATGYALAGGQAVNPGNLQIGKYLSPYLGMVLGSESALLNQNNQQQQAGQLGNAISQGAFGGDRAGIAAANLEQQQNLANANIYSGILNTGWNTALGTAQQQQGVTLSADQANRAALQQTGQALSSIGQQQYSQGMGLGTAQQGLAGQIFGQGATTAAQEAALGQQQFGQGLAAAGAQQGLGQTQFQQGLGTASALQGLGETQFGQGLAGSQQLAALGQGIYGIGSSQASGLANLGTGAQSAALQGAQGELSAGQVQQQTQQAGLTALYNQFLQQQSYPFQVDQFLANIAEGTGALSGSTTTTTQPGGFFSDKRLKDDIEPVGETYDGQKIVRFRYKGDPRKQIGLVAQDVEKSHPGAVGLAGGYRTVDYGKATDDAAERGHFRRGGLAAANDDYRGYAEGGSAYGTYGPGLPGLTSSDISAILQAQAAMYAPYTSGGLYGGSSSGAPRGGSSYVPQASLPVGHLAVADGRVDRPKSGMEQASDIVSLADNGEKAAKGLGSLFHGSGGDGGSKSYYDLGKDLSDSGDMPAFARGGMARRGLASGGDTDPYNTVGPSLDIPDQAPKDLSIMQPGQVGKPKSGLSQVADIAKTAADVAKVAAMFSRGGLAGDDSGMAPPSDEPAEDDQRSSVMRIVQQILQEDDAPESDHEQNAPPGVSASPVPVAAPAPMATPHGLAGAPTLPSDLNGAMALIERAEGEGKNPKSSARGPYQFVDPTFVSVFRQAFPDRAQGMTKAQILALRSTPEGDSLSREMGPVLAMNNAASLKEAGVDPDATSLYLAHFLGPHGALKFLRADPQTPAPELVSPLEVKENPTVLGPNRTAGDVINWARSRLQQVSRPAHRAGGSVRRGFADGGDAGAEDPISSDLQPSSDGQGGTDYLSDRLPEQEGDHRGLMHSLSKPETFLPILAGLAAMGTAPTRSFGVALASGLGAGASAYQQQRAFQLQQQETENKTLQAGAYAQQPGIERQRIGVDTFKAKTERLQAQMAAFSQAQQVFDANYQPMGEAVPGQGQVYLNRLTGEKLTQAQYSAERDRYLQSALSGIGGAGVGPLNAAATLGSANALPDGGGGHGPGGGGSGGGGVGPVPAEHGVVLGGPDAAHGSGGSGVHGVSGPPGVPAPVRLDHAPRNVAEKIQSGAYLSPGMELPAVDTSALPDASNPQWLMSQGQALRTSGVTPELRAQGQNYVDQAQKIENGEVLPLDKHGQPYMGYARLAQARQAANAVTQGYAAQKNAKNEAASEFSSQLGATGQLQNALIRVYAAYNTNRLSEAFADLVGKAASVPGLSQKLAPLVATMESPVDEAKKETARQAIVATVAAGMASHAPASALRQANITVPNPGMAPGARYDLAVQQAALLRREQDYWRDWGKFKDRVNDVPTFDNDWAAEHPVSKYEDWAYNRITPFAGMTQQEMLKHPRRPKSPADLQGLPPGIPFVIPTGPNAGKIGTTR